MAQLNYHLAVLSLSFLWIFTGIVSWLLSPDIGYQVLAQANIVAGLADFCIISGSIVDCILGLWLLSYRKLKLCCYLQLMVIAVYSLLLTVIDASYWLHPFGPLSKNIPIFVLIMTLLQQHAARQSQLN